MKRIAIILALSSISIFSAAQPAKVHTIAGYISDSKCGAMHMDNGIGCVKQCIENGNHPVFVDVNKKVLAIENPDEVKHDYGDNVKVEATVNEAKKSIFIHKVTKTGGVMGGMKDGIGMKM